MKATITVEIPDHLSNLLPSAKLVEIVKKVVEDALNHPDIVVTKTHKEN